MFLEVLISLSFLFIIIFTSIGYGQLFNKIILKENLHYSIGEIGLYGLFFLSFLSILINFFIPINYFVTFLICFIGVILFLIYINFKFINLYNLLILVLILPTIIFFEYHADYFWYHLPYINLKNEFKIIFGIANLNDNLGYSHIWYDLLSVFNLPIYSTYYLSIVSSAFIFFILLIFKDVYLYTSINLVKYFLLLSVCFVFLVYSDPKDFGSEIQGNIIYLLICVYILVFFEKKNEVYREYLITKILIIFFFAILIRSNSILFSPIILILIIINFKIFFNTIMKNKIFYFFIFFFFCIYLTKNIITTGCLSYPIYYTCFDSIEWSIGIEHARLKFYHLSAQSKGYLVWLKNENFIEHIFDYYKFRQTPEYISPEIYLKEYNWIKYWWLYEHDVDRLLNIVYFFTLLALLFLVFNFYKIHITKLIENIKLDLFKILFFLLPCITVFYFLPQSRYGGYGVLFVFLYILFSSLLFKGNKINIIPIYFILIISVSYFQLKNYDRISNNYHLLQNNIQKNFYSYPEETLIAIKKNTNTYDLDINIREFGKNDRLGKPLFCYDIKGLCSSIIRIPCIKKIKLSNNYVYVIPKEKFCSKIIDEYLWY